MVGERCNIRGINNAKDLSKNMVTYYCGIFYRECRETYRDGETETERYKERDRSKTDTEGWRLNRVPLQEGTNK